MQQHQALYQIAFTLRGKVAGVLGFGFLATHLQRDFRPLVQQRDELGVNVVDLLSQVLEAHDGILFGKGRGDSCRTRVYFGEMSFGTGE